MLLAIENFWPPFSQTCLPLLFCRLFHHGGQLEKPSLSCLRRYARRWKFVWLGGWKKERGEKNWRIFLKDRGFSNPLFFDEEIFDKREKDSFLITVRSLCSLIIISSNETLVNRMLHIRVFKFFYVYIFFLRCKCS